MRIAHRPCAPPTRRSPRGMGPRIRTIASRTTSPPWTTMVMTTRGISDRATVGHAVAPVAHGGGQLGHLRGPPPIRDFARWPPHYGSVRLGQVLPPRRDRS